MIEWALPHQLGADTVYDISAEGVRCSISVPSNAPSADLSGSAAARPGASY